MIYDLEVTNHCNLHCDFCPREVLTRPQGFLDPIATLSRVIGHIQSNPGRVHLTGFGEPLLHPEIVKIVRALASAGLDTVITTNGTLATNVLLAELADAGLKQFYLSFSWPVHSTEGLDRFLDFRHMTTVVIVDSLISVGRVSQRIARDYGYVVNLFDAHNRGGNIENVSQLPELNRLGKRCRVFEEIEFIAWNGDILPCCNDLAGYALGQVGTSVDHTTLARWPMCERCSTP
jgi:organic radical activating enzyme